MQFLGLSLADAVPDGTTLWLFRQQLTDAGLIEALFEQFESYLQAHGYKAQGGQILDATLIPVPKQHITKEEKEQLDQGEIPQDWQDKPHRMSQRDLDATWTKKNNVSHFGYKDHINVDVEHGFIRNYSVTDAAVHDSIVLADILDEDNEGDGVWAEACLS